MRLSPSYALSEFEKHGRVPAEAISILAEFCGKVLEPIRAKFGPITITSGYRPPDANELAGGVKTSYHVYKADRCAADIMADDVTVLIRKVFDWLRLESFLPFDKVILEIDKASGIPQVIHVQFSRTPRRLAYTGQTHGTGAYVMAPVRSVPTLGGTMSNWVEGEK